MTWYRSASRGTSSPQSGMEPDVPMTSSSGSPSPLVSWLSVTPVRQAVCVMVGSSGGGGGEPGRAAVHRQDPHPPHPPRRPPADRRPSRGSPEGGSAVGERSVLEVSLRQHLRLLRVLRSEEH